MGKVAAGLAIAARSVAEGSKEVARAVISRITVPALLRSSIATRTLTVRPRLASCQAARVCPAVGLASVRRTDLLMRREAAGCHKAVVHCRSLSSPVVAVPLAPLVLRGRPNRTVSGRLRLG